MSSHLTALSRLLLLGQFENRGLISNSTSATTPPARVYISSLITSGNITAGQFFLLNPDLDPYCGNIQADTDYCVRGFIEPLRGFDGLCGPPNKNATCRGTRLQCCNANTFTCGGSLEDCADGTCYEGACAGDKVFTTNGDCDRDHGYKMCAGVWGDCCNDAGRCGSGPSFCAYANDAISGPVTTTSQNSLTPTTELSTQASTTASANPSVS
ncbi:hypothetical protein HYFRA_00010906 [Hymenoscyphus fraxineus]|uniref:Chitin-binding type-1 domain-containing protein n=1 Tax=Hymenoscyphus fraxineus TaxID=746836 RepID=A0A9N9PS92_9HELO|nr:hypothetical protein HYFRA_00010906 [Hymenoscyphus fraxineus]